MASSRHLPETKEFWRPHILIGTWFGAGLLPGAPGTWGSLAALPFAWALQFLGGPLALAAGFIAVTLAGTWAAGRIAAAGTEEDPQIVVVDEVAGQWLTLIPAATNPLLFAAGFVLFRLADIVKPWPVSWADRHVPGARGIMLDDMLAGIYAGVALFALAFWLGI